MAYTPIQNNHHISPFSHKSQFNFNKLTIFPKNDFFYENSTPVKYSEISAKVVDWSQRLEPIDITTGETIIADPRIPLQDQTWFGNLSQNAAGDPRGENKPVFFTIVVEANHTRTDIRGHRDQHGHTVSLETLVPYTIQWTVYKRFNEFQKLYESLAKQFQNIPKFPSKELWSTITKNSNDDQILQTKRMLALSNWISTLLLTPAILHSEDVDQFLRLHQHVSLDMTEFPEKFFSSSQEGFFYGVTDMIWDDKNNTIIVTGEDGSYRAKADAKASSLLSTASTNNGALRVYSFQENGDDRNGEKKFGDSFNKNNVNNQNNDKDIFGMEKLDLNRNFKILPQQISSELFSSRASCISLHEYDNFDHHLPLIDVKTLPNDVVHDCFGDFYNIFPEQYPNRDENKPIMVKLPTTHIKTGPLYVPRMSSVVNDLSSSLANNRSGDHNNNHNNHNNPQSLHSSAQSQHIHQNGPLPTAINMMKTSPQDKFFFVGLDSGEICIYQYSSHLMGNIPTANVRRIAQYKAHNGRIEKISFVKVFANPLANLSPENFLKIGKSSNNNNHNNHNNNNNDSNNETENNNPQNEEYYFEGILSSSRDGQIILYDLRTDMQYPLLHPVVANYGPISHHYWNQYTQMLYFSTFDGYIVSYQLLINRRTGALMPKPIHAIHYYSHCVRKLTPVINFDVPRGAYNTSQQGLFATSNYQTNQVDFIDFEQQNKSKLTLFRQENFPQLLFSIPLLTCQCKNLLLLPLYLPGSFGVNSNNINYINGNNIPEQKITSVSTTALSFAQPMVVLDENIPTQSSSIDDRNNNNNNNNNNNATDKSSQHSSNASNNNPIVGVNKYTAMVKNTHLYYLITGHAGGFMTMSIVNIHKQSTVLLYVIQAHNDEITDIRYIPNRDLIVTASRDKTIAGWRLPFPRSFIERIL